jgi:aspartate/methionine/tyrosine aminotransferase
MNYSHYFNSATIESMQNLPNDKWLRYPKDVIPLWLANPDFLIAPEIKEALIKAVEANDLYYNSDRPARQAMAEKIKRVNNFDVTIDDLMITQGVDPYIWLAVRQACNPGDEVVLTDPMYGEFNNVMGPLGTKPVYWELELDEGYRFDPERLKEIIGPKTKLIGVCNPHNPTGRVMTKEELKAIADIAVDHQIKVFVDELWEDIIFDNKQHITMATLNPEIEELTSTSWGVSKTFGVAGLYLGYVCTTNKEILTGFRRYAKCIQRGSTTLARAAAPVMLDNTLDWWRREIMVHLHKIREICLERFNEIPGVYFPEFEGTYVPLIKFDYNMTSKELFEYLLKEAKVALAPGSNYGPKGEGHQRICIATSEAIINETIDRVEVALRKIQ